MVNFPARKNTGKFWQDINRGQISTKLSKKFIYFNLRRHPEG